MKSLPNAIPLDGGRVGFVGVRVDVLGVHIGFTGVCIGSTKLLDANMLVSVK